MPKPSPNLLRHSIRVDVDDAVPLARAGDRSRSQPFELAASVITPRSIGPEPVVLVCLPGGFLSRAYYDLESPEASDADSGARPDVSSKASDRRFSFAAAMAERGFITIAFDPFGVGESSRPEPEEDAYLLGVETLAAIHQRGLEKALAWLAQSDAPSGLPAVVAPRLFGVGHSMGSVLTVEQQASAAPYEGLILFSFTTAGVPRFLSEAQREWASDPLRARREIGRLTRETMGSPYPARAANSESDRVAAFGVGTAPPEAEEALHRASTSLLGVAGLLSMIPGGFAPAAEQIEVPVLIALGDHDLHDASGLAAMLPKSPRVETFVLDDSWHCHFVANTREALWQRVASWIEEQVRHP